MTAVGVTERPDRVYLVEWTDIFGVQRKAITSDARDTDLRYIDPDFRVLVAEVEWKEPADA